MAQCPCADSLTGPGWSSVAAMHGHIDVHLARGEVPQEWLDRHRRTRCRVCSLSVAAGRGVHPTCRPQERAQAARREDDAEGAPALPSADAVFSQRARTLKHVPRVSRTVWAQALTRSLAAIVAYSTGDAWLEFAMLPKVLLLPPSPTRPQERQGGGHDNGACHAEITHQEVQQLGHCGTSPTKAGLASTPTSS